MGAAIAASAGSFSFGSSFIHGERATAQLAAVQLLDRFPRVIVGTHLDEREATGPARHLVTHHSDRFHRPDTRKQVLQFTLTHFERQVANVQFPTHDIAPFVPATVVVQLTFKRSESRPARSQEAAKYGAQ